MEGAVALVAGQQEVHLLPRAADGGTSGLGARGRSQGRVNLNATYNTQHTVRLQEFTHSGPPYAHMCCACDRINNQWGRCKRTGKGTCMSVERKCTAIHSSQNKQHVCTLSTQICIASFHLCGNTQSRKVVKASLAVPTEPIRAAGQPGKNQYHLEPRLCESSTQCHNCFPGSVGVGKLP